MIFLNIDNDKFLKKAFDSRVNSMVWLYCALHYCSAWRKIDYKSKLPKPNLKITLGIEPERFINWIKEGNYFTEEMGQAVCNYVIDEIKFMRKKHSKNNNPFTFEVGNSLVRPIGFLLALCESHRVIESINKTYYNSTVDSMITESVKDRRVHVRFFGDKYNQIFKDDSFGNLKAVHTQLHIIRSKSSEKGWGIGYHLASLLRGHKQNSKRYSKTTEIYLRDINRNNDLDRITYNLYERGTFGFIPHILLDIVYGDKFNELDISEKTQTIKDLAPFSPNQIENISKSLHLQKLSIKNTIRDLLISDKNNIQSILEKISNGKAPSKMEYSQCLIKVINKKSCAYPSKGGCIGCEYLIPEMYFLLEFKKELYRLLDKINNSKLLFDKQRYSYIMINSYLPILNEGCKVFGKKRVNTFIDIKNLQNRLQILAKNNQLLIGE